MPSTSWRAAIARNGRIQLIGPRKSLMITAIPRRRSGRRNASMATAKSPRTPTGAFGIVAMARNSCLLVLTAGACRHPNHLLAVGNQRAESVSAPAVEKRDGSRGRHRQVTFLADCCAEVQAGRQVDHQPGLQFAVGDHLPDVRMGGARGDRPVHPAYIVAGLILARLPWLRTGAGDQAQVVAVQDTVELAFDRELECAKCRRQLRVVDLPALHRRRTGSHRLVRGGIRIGHRPLAVPAACITGGTE